jgi:FixJ family two-component response regulator
MPDAKPTVLVIDDDSDLRASIARLLRSLDMDTLLFASISEFFKSVPPNGPICLARKIHQA